MQNGTGQMTGQVHGQMIGGGGGVDGQVAAGTTIHPEAGGQVVTDETGGHVTGKS